MVDKTTNDTVLRKTTFSELLGCHLSNIYDPKKPGTKRYFCYSHDASMGGPHAKEEEWQQYLDWVNRGIIGPPEETDHYSREDLEQMGMVGIYAKPQQTN